MEEQRRNQIAYILFKRQLGEKGVPLNKEAIKDLRRISSNKLEKDDGVSYEELLEFFKKIIYELVEETFKK